MKISNSYLDEARGKADLFVAGAFQDDSAPPSILKSADNRAFKITQAVMERKRFEGASSDVFSTVDSGLKQAGEFLLIGLGKKEEWTREALRKKVSGLYREAKARKASSVRILAESFLGNSAGLNDAAEVIPESLLLSDYRFDKYRSKKKNNASRAVRSVEILYSKKVKKRGLDEALRRSEIISEAVLFTRNLINEPANVMSPEMLATEARRAAREGKLKCEVLGPVEIRRRKMGGILAVSQGSSAEPRLVVLEYGSRFKSSAGTICLVGKGVCFDTGGISLKPAKDMEKMKYDMSGAAAVIGTMKALSGLKPKLHVVGIAPCVENMPSGRAQRPGDIITMLNGKTVEVINTDAEGRLILGDALAFTERFKPKAVIDLATLTGACAVALSDKAAGLLGTDAALLKKVRDAGERTGERCWELPLWEEYFEQIKGHHSDLLNVGGGGGGTITAAMFLKQFVPVKSWAHLDIASTAWVDSDKPLRPRGATGIGVRILCELLRNWQAPKST